LGEEYTCRAPHYVVFSTPLLPRPSYAQLFSSTPHNCTFAATSEDHAVSLITFSCNPFLRTTLYFEMHYEHVSYMRGFTIPLQELHTGNSTVHSQLICTHSVV
jgi:hypothetical protein